MPIYILTLLGIYILIKDVLKHSAVASYYLTLLLQMATTLWPYINLYNN